MVVFLFFISFYYLFTDIYLIIHDFMNNILNKRNGLTVRLSNSEYYDFKLYLKGGEDLSYVYGDTEYRDNLIAEFFFDKRINLNKMNFSTCNPWKRAINNSVVLSNIGFVGMDNGLIPYSSKCDEFLNILTSYKYPIFIKGEEFDTFPIKPFITNVNGYSQNYKYDINITDKCAEFKGGFFQGFYKIHEEDYQTIPDRPIKEWGFEFILEPKDYSEKLTINETHPENKGIFFYMGLRAENKFWYYTDIEDSPYSDSNDTFCVPCFYDKEIQNENGVYFKSINLDRYETDNNFLIYNRTKDGIKIGYNDSEYDKLIIYDYKNNPDYNGFLEYNRDGNTINQVSKEIILDTDIDLESDILNNCISFQIKDDGSIGYKCLIMKPCEKRILPCSDEYFDKLNLENICCDNEDEIILLPYLISEFSRPNLIKKDEKTHIFVRYVTNQEIDNPSYLDSSRVCKLMFYINGKLEFVTNEFIEPMFRPLSEIKEKQEGVPYNISIGGGTLGLLETVLYDNCINRKILPIEENFCGSFIGNIYKFKMYNGVVDFTKILNNYKFELKNNSNEQINLL